MSNDTTQIVMTSTTVATTTVRMNVGTAKTAQPVIKTLDTVLLAASLAGNNRCVRINAMRVTMVTVANNAALDVVNIAHVLPTVIPVMWPPVSALVGPGGDRTQHALIVPTDTTTGPATVAVSAVTVTVGIPVTKTQATAGVVNLGGSPYSVKRSAVMDCMDKTAEGNVDTAARVQSAIK
ncbi:hypothetical protein V1264_020977 [Littorina saxatilis]|uniref:Uncharacterized protein n=1 Tax=Littorina saxatilis TaxID=31220 RepID=A0AAN9BDR1_9CAEN